MEQSYPNSKECVVAILKEVYGWNDRVKPKNPMEYIKGFLERNQKYFRSKINDDNFIINHDFDNKTTEWKADIKYIYNPDSDFNSFVSSASTHDGTLLFVFENIYNCIHDLIYLIFREFGERCNAPVGKGDRAEVIFGDITIANANKPEFGTPEKPWRTQRTIVVIPTKLVVKRCKDD